MGHTKELAAADNAPRLGRAFIQDPHELYRRLRVEAPAHRVLMWGGKQAWLVTRYAEARAALADPRLSKDWRNSITMLPWGAYGPHRSPLNDHMLMNDPPDHTRLRKLVTAAFTARAVQALRSNIVRIADELLDQVAAAAAGPVDLMQAYAIQLPLQVIGELLGVPARDADEFRTRIEPLLTSADPAELRTAEDALADLLAELITGKREVPTDDLFSSLVHMADVDDRLSEDELVATALLLIVAGYETTVNLIGNGILALLHNPSQLATLRADLSLLPSAVEEFLRFESPLNLATVRFSTETVQVGEVEIPAGQLVFVALLAANHDARRYDHPDRLDVTRNPNPHLAFGHGIHHCLGAPLARLEGEIAIGRLLTRFERITLDRDAVVRYRSSTLMRGLTALPVRIS
jgi:cytochrome P450